MALYNFVKFTINGADYIGTPTPNVLTLTVNGTLDIIANYAIVTYNVKVSTTPVTAQIKVGNTNYDSGTVLSIQSGASIMITAPATVTA